MARAGSWLITIEGIVDADAVLNDIVERLQHETRKPADEWRRALLAPGLGRIVLSANTENEGKTIGEHMAKAGLVPHVVDAAEATNAIESAFEAVWAEPVRDDVLVIAHDGKDLKVPSSSIRLVVSGKQARNGVAESFVVLGLRDGCGAVILRFPGADVSKITGDIENPDDVVPSFLEALAYKVVPHAVIDRGLERGGKLAGLKEVGSDDLAHGAVIASWLHRRFPPASKAKAQAMAAPFPESPFHAAPFPDPPPAPAPSSASPSASLELGARKVSARSLPVDAADGFGAMPPPEAPARPRVVERPAKQPLSAEQKKKRMIAAGVAAFFAIVAAVALLRTPAKSEHLLHMHDAWKSPYGITFSFDNKYDAGIADVPDLGFVVTATKGGESTTFRVAKRDAAETRDAFGIAWHITSADDASGSWIAIEAKKP